MPSLPSSAAIATSDPRATAVGAAVLRAGGNCVDAAVAATLALFVLEPHHCGPGGDGFALVQLPGMQRPEALDGSGAVPARLTEDALAADGHGRVPPLGAASVTVPGAPALLETALERWGTRPLAELVGPAVAFASEGFEVRASLAGASDQAQQRLAADEVLAELYLRDGASLRAGDRVVNPWLAALLDDWSIAGTDSIYRGSVAHDIATAIAQRGGYLDRADLAAHRTVELEPVSTCFAGATVWQLPEPTQGPAVLAALAALAHGDRVEDDDADAWSTVAQAITEGLLAVGVDLVKAPWRRPQGGTSHLAVVDGQGGVASFISSVFAPFGSGVGVQALGGPLQNRAAGFLLLDKPPTPGKPPHTLIPGLVTRGADTAIALGVAGGLMQVQGQVQLLVRLLRRGEGAAAAVAAPRLRVVEGGRLALEADHPLARREPVGIGRPPGDGGFGCAQVALRSGDGVSAAADRRRGGAAEVVRSSDREAQGGRP